MNDAEVIRKVVAILTELSTWTGSPGADQDPPADGMKLVGEIVDEFMVAEAEIPDGASPQEIATIAATALTPGVARAFGAFARAFHDLAQEHDRHNPAVTSADILRRLALEADAETDD
ncbi:hypothetical protein [Streptomyces sp. NPDC052225]|uniref:hypothetical protein n=1 Tax=Streptomyces sp. NPDC052225 TaxID=3154949 RepID=UPI00342CEE0F